MMKGKTQTIYRWDSGQNEGAAVDAAHGAALPAFRKGGNGNGRVNSGAEMNSCGRLVSNKMVRRRESGGQGKTRGERGPIKG
jgi:hypothetical protein